MKSGPTIMIVDDDAAFRHVMGSELGRLDFEIVPVESGEDAIRRVTEVDPDVILLDLQLPGMNGLEALRVLHERRPACEIIMLTGHGTIDTAIESIRAGAFDYVMKPCPLDELEVRIQRALERQSLRQRATLLERGLTPPDVAGSFVGDSPGFRQMMHMVERVAPTDSTVLITGETGSGKEMVAKLVHGRSLRRSRPFVVVECAALQESLLQSELFGHERGAFTGADRAKPGLFEVATGGTIFLDEIGEVSLATQVKLLRVIDTSTFRHVGGTAEIKVDVRVLAATNRNMQEMVRQGLFREDLFYRLSTISLHIPPLRERQPDIDLLARHFVSIYNERFGQRKRIGEETLAVLRRHPWPGNVRELQHVIEAAMVVCEEGEIQPEHLPASLRLPATAPPVAPAAVATTVAADGTLPTLDELERIHIETALRSTGGHRGKTAAILGISERNLYRKIREYNLPD